jgi:hypothetical protein
MNTRRGSLWACGILALVAAFSGCDLLNPASRLYGTWKLDVDTTIDRAAGGNAFKKAALQTMWSFAGGDVTMEFRPDGTGEMKGNSALGSGNESGTWKLVSAESSSLRVELTTDKGTHEQVLRMLDPNTFEVDLNAGGQVNTATFRRVVQ